MWKAATKQITGTNDVPLGTRRRFGPAPVESTAPPQLAQPSPSAFPRAPEPEQQNNKRQREETNTPSEPDLNSNGSRKRRSRWGDARVELPGLPTAIAADGVSQAQLDNYAIHLRIEEINRKLRLNDYIPPERERSLSPPPTYDSQGRRTNTREVRYKKKLEDERIKLVERALKADPNYRPPIEYQQQKRSQRPQEKVYIPVKEFPEINFFGLLVGPRGNSLKKMERESGAKISIRGKGSVKEGKSRPDAFAEDSEEDLHCLIMADSEEKVAKCVAMINRVIETAASTPEGQNDHKRNQLRELAALNGTLRDDENQVCQNCGNVGHRKYDCPEQRNFTANIVCRICGSGGHMARDCTLARKDPNGVGVNQGGSPDAQNNSSMTVGAPNGSKGFVDSEYANLMAELGEGATKGNNDQKPSWGSSALPQVASSDLPPWRRPEVWQTATTVPQNQNQGYRPPQANSYAGYGNTGTYPQQAGYNGYTGSYNQQDYSAAYAQYYQQQYTQQQA